MSAEYTFGCSSGLVDVVSDFRQHFGHMVGTTGSKIMTSLKDLMGQFVKALLLASKFSFKQNPFYRS